MLKIHVAPVLVPIIDWLPEYKWSVDFFSDLNAGITVFLLLIPQGMAYAVLAGMPPVYGLYTAIVPLYIYALLGTSRQLSLGPFAITSLLLGNTCSSHGFEDGSPQYIQLVATMSMIAGVISLILGIFRMGVLANFLSHSVLTGFVTASACVITLSQMKYLLGIHVPRMPYTHQTIYYLLTHLGEVNVNALLVGFFAVVGLYAAKVWKQKNKPTPGSAQTRLFKFMYATCNIASLIAILVGILVAYLITSRGGVIDIVGNVPAGLLTPGFSLGVTSFNQFIALIPDSFILTIIGFTGNWAITTRYAKINKYDCSATQELIASGFANILGVVFRGFYASGGLARSAVNAESGARTQLSGCITATCIVFSLLFLTTAFHYIPMSILGAIIVVSVISMMDFAEMKKAYTLDQTDCLVMVVTFLFTFFYGISQGIGVGVLVSMSMLLYHSAFPAIVHLGRLNAGTAENPIYIYRNVKRFEQAELIDGISIIRMDAALYFANANHLKEFVMASVAQRRVAVVLLDASAWVEIDMAGVNALVDLRADLQFKSIALALINTKYPIRHRLAALPFASAAADAPFMFDTVESALAHLKPEACDSGSSPSPPPSLSHEHEYQRLQPNEVTFAPFTAL